MVSQLQNDPSLQGIGIINLFICVILGTLVGVLFITNIVLDQPKNKKLKWFALAAFIVAGGFMIYNGNRSAKQDQANQKIVNTIKTNTDKTVANEQRNIKVQKAMMQTYQNELDNATEKSNDKEMESLNLKLNHAQFKISDSQLKIKQARHNYQIAKNQADGISKGFYII